MKKFYCDDCDNEIKVGEEVFETTSGYVCNICYKDAVCRAENAYDVAKDEGRV